MTRQSHRRRLAGALLLGCSLVPVAEASLSTATLVASAASPSCISWRISGICYWLKWGEGGGGRLPYPDICPGVTFYSAGGGLGLPCPG